MSSQQLTEELSRLYAEQLTWKYEEYLYLQSRSAGGIRRRIEAFQLYQPYLTAGRILDWGCKHSVDGCLIRKVLESQVEIHGCDFGENDFRIFHHYAGLKFIQLSHPYQLPYPDGEFDIVISSGVLEHVPNDGESLKEIYRILKPGGRLIITFLPNKYSYTEFIVGLLGGPNHKRPYKMNEVRQMLLHHGFLPKFATYHQMIPSFSSLGSKRLGENKIFRTFIKFLFSFNRAMEHLWLVRSVCSNLLFVSEKVEHF